MVIEVISKENAEDYRGFLPDAFYRTEIPLGIVCIDEEEDVPIGFTMLTLKEESLLIEYLYVMEEYRRRGAGTMMLRGAGEMAEAAGTHILEIYYNALQEGDDLPEQFLLENGFLISKEGELLEFTSSDLFYSDYVKNITYPKVLDAYSCIPIGQLSADRESRLIRLLTRHGGAAFLPFISREMSFVCEKGGKETGCILCGYDEEKSTVTIMGLISFTDDPMGVAKLLITLGYYVVDHMEKETYARFLKTEEFKVALAEKLLGGADKLRTAGELLHGVKLLGTGR